MAAKNKGEIIEGNNAESSTVQLVLQALMIVAGWVFEHREDLLEPLLHKKASKEERLQDAEKKLIQVGAATLELNQKIDAEVDALRKEIRTMKLALIVIGATLIASIIAIILLTILH